MTSEEKYWFPASTPGRKLKVLDLVGEQLADGVQKGTKGKAAQLR